MRKWENEKTEKWETRGEEMAKKKMEKKLLSKIEKRRYFKYMIFSNHVIDWVRENHPQIYTAAVAEPLEIFLRKWFPT